MKALIQLLNITFFIIATSLTTTSAFAEYSYSQMYLPSDVPSVVHCIFKDKYGFIWMGTRAGLFRYDGQNIKNFNKEKDSIVGGYIYNILQDDNGTLWVLTNKGVCIYDYSTNNFNFIKDKNDKILMATSAINYKKKLILGGKNKIYCYDSYNKSIKDLIKFNEINDYNITNIIAIGNDSLLCSDRWYGMRFIDLKTKHISHAFPECENEITCSFQDNSGNIWISTYNKGVRCYDKNYRLKKHYSKENSGIGSNIVMSIIEHKGEIWFGTDGDGISILNQRKNSFEILKHIPGENNYSLPTNSIICLYEDYYGNIWIGSIYYGLICMHEVSMRTYKDVLPGNNSGLTNSTALFLYNGGKEELWIGTNGGGLNKYNLNTGKFTHYQNTIGDKISSICDFGNNKLLVFNFAKGVYIFDTIKETKEDFTIIDKENNERLCNHGNSVFIYRNTPSSILFLADLVYWYDEKTHKFETIQEKNGNNVSIGSLVAIGKDSLYTYLNDIERIYKLNNKSKILESIFQAPEGISLSSVSIDQNGIIWAGTNNGLIKYDIQNNSFDFIRTELFKSVSSVVCVQSNKVLIGSESMLFCWNEDKKKFVFFGESDGVMPNEYMPQSKWVDKDGQVFMGGVRGLLKIDNLTGYEKQSVPSLNLSEIEVNGMKTFLPIDENIPELKISESGSLILRVFANGDDILKKKMYKFKINGEKSSREIKTYSSELALHSLSAGKYAITASCNTKDGNQTEEKCILKLNVTPPWYKTEWFFFSCLIAIALIFIYINILTIRKKTEKHNLIIKEREKQMYEDKIRFLINISHELRTPLTLIHAPLQRVLKTMSMDNPLFLQLKGVFRQTQRMKNLINMVLDVRKMEVGDGKLNLSTININDYIKYIGQDFIDEAQAIGTDLIYNLDLSVDYLEADKQKLESILTNLLINALKHSNNGGCITISTENNIKEHTVRISVSDKGKGLKNVDTNKLFSRFYQGAGEETGTGIGLSYSKILVEMHAGKIGAYNNEDKGATFYFELPKFIRADKECEKKPYLNELFFDFNGDANPEKTQLSETDTSSYTVIVVDDNADLRDFLKSSLKEHFKKIITASEGEEALKLIKSYSPDIVVSDVMMPGMNGYQLCKSIKQDFEISHLPVILLTAKDDSTSKLYGYKNGADDYIVKPFDIDMLLEIIKNRLRNRDIARKSYCDKGKFPTAESTTFSQVDEVFMININSIINRNINNPELDVHMICREVGMSRTSVYSKLKNLTNMGINDYINKIRMEKSIELLSNTNMSFVEIATSIGFTSQSYFSTTFKQYTGKTPTVYRKEVKKTIENIK